MIEFSSDNEWGIPVLDLDLQAEDLILPAIAWGSQSRNKQFGGTWHFYEDDRKFSTLWGDFEQLLPSRPTAIIEPNYSTSLDSPLAWVIWTTYQKRYIARWAQRVGGIRVWVDLHVAVPVPQIAIAGVPEGWRSFATSATGKDLDDLEWEYEVLARSRHPEPRFLVIGGGPQLRISCGKRGWLWLPGEQDARRGRYSDGKK